MKSKSNYPRVRTEVTKDWIIKDLKRIGVKEGDHVAVTLSLKSIGYVKGGPDAFIDALLETVGPHGTIMMNTYTRASPRGNPPISSIPRSDYIFDCRSTPAWTGIVPEAFRKRKDAIRSRHPISSVTAVGRYARYLTDGHDENSSSFIPYSRLAGVDSKYLCIGLGHNLVAIRHEAQRLAGLFDVVPAVYGVKYRDADGKVRIYVYNIHPCVRKLPELVPPLKKMGVVKTGKIGMAYSIIAPVKDLIEEMTKMLKNDPTLNLCDKVYCLWCREAERRLDLYGRIENPKYFQKNPFFIGIISFINSSRLIRGVDSLRALLKPSR